MRFGRVDVPDDEERIATYKGKLDFDALRAISCCAHTLVSAVLCGQPNLIQSRIYEWMKGYGLGDLVVETSTTWHEGDRTYAVGILEKMERKHVCRHEYDDPNLTRCGECDGTERPDGTGWRWWETYHWLRTMPDAEGRTSRRWHNASFVRVPMNLADMRQAEGH